MSVVVSTACAGRRRRPRQIARLHVSVVVAVLASCVLPDDAPFGRRCVDDAGCVQGYVCERDQCVPFADFFADVSCADDAACDDGRFCTPAAACREGQCVPIVDVVCQGSAQCFEASDQCLECSASVPCLDDGDDCVEQLCDVERGCVAVPIAGCARCDIDDDCVSASACEVAGACVRHRCTFAPRDCGGRGCDASLGCACVGVGAAEGCAAEPCGTALCTPDGVCERTPPACEASACVEQTGTCATCFVDADCDLDASACTSDRCDTARSVCVRDASPCPGQRCVDEQGTPTCISECVDAGDCVSDDPCQPAGTCDGGTCTYPATISCAAGLGCVVDEPGGPPRCLGCLVDGDCATDDNPCTEARCAVGRCRQIGKDCRFGCDADSVDGACFACASALDCNDSISCTVDACVGGACVHRVERDDDADDCGRRGCLERVGRCSECLADADCLDDDNACTAERCLDGVCVRVEVTTCENGCLPASGCGACDGPDSCDDGDACTDDGCVEGVCTHARRARCGPECSAHRDCNDDDACTADFCSGGVCERVPRSDCPDSCEPITGLCAP